MKKIEYYKHINGKVPVKIWLKTLDIALAKRVFNRLLRIEEDENFGDYKKIDDDISELRFQFGSGYRIYYSEIEDIMYYFSMPVTKNFRAKILKKRKNI